MTLKKSFISVTIIFFVTIALIVIWVCVTTINKSDVGQGKSVIHLPGGTVKTLDPALADDSPSRNLAGTLYDTLLQYDYVERPYKLIPSALEKMPECSADFTTYNFTLRRDLYYRLTPQSSPKQLTAKDVQFSILRLADARLHSPLYWMIRGKIRGIESFNQTTAKIDKGDMSPYEKGILGFTCVDDFHFTIKLNHSDPRFLYLLAMPNAALIPREVLYNRDVDLSRTPISTGAFRIKKIVPDSQIILERNPDYREEYFNAAVTPEDRKRKLPLADEIVVHLIKQPLPSWLLFLQGGLDLYELNKDNSDLVNAKGEIPDALQKRGIKLIRQPEFEIRYIGFNFNDEKLGKNLKLRRALSLAYDVDERVQYSGNQLIPAQTILPAGVPGYDENYVNPFAKRNIIEAQKMLAEAGYPSGIDPATGRPLTLDFDQAGNSSQHRQIGEITAADFAEIGVHTRSCLNNKARFFEKIRHDRCQMFRLSWVGDYPDAENFLQLFYSGNIGSCNRTGFSDPEFDKMYEKILLMPDSPERTDMYRAMSIFLAQKCVWIYEGFPITHLLCHSWLENYLPHDFAFSRWKYLSVKPQKKKQEKVKLKPLSFNEI